MRSLRALLASNTSRAHERRNPDGPPGWAVKFLAKNGRRIVERTGADFHHYYGCGAYGCAFGSRDPRWTVKITADEWEAKLAAFCVAVRSHAPSALAGVVQFGALYASDLVAVDWQSKPARAFVIVRESVLPITDHDVRASAHGGARARWLVRGIDLLIDAREAAKRAFDAKRASAEQVALRQYRTALDDLRDIEPFRFVAATMEELLHRYNVLCLDAHYGNIGRTIQPIGVRRRDDLVIFDLGATPTEFPAQFAPKTMPRL